MESATLRMSMRRFTRLTNSFSKKIDHHGHAVALHFVHDNFVPVHKTIRVTPAMETGTANHVLHLEAHDEAGTDNDTKRQKLSSSPHTKV